MTFANDENIFNCLDNNNSLRILTLTTIEIYQVLSYKKWNLSLMITTDWCDSTRRPLKYWENYKSFEKQISLDEVYNHPVISSIGDIADALKLVQNISPTGQLWLQFMDFALIIRMFVLNGQVILNCISLHWNKCCLI